MAATLISKAGSVNKKEFKLEGGKTYSLGRSREATVIVNDKQVSRRHCNFEAAPDGNWVVTDLGSSNGTYVNRQKIATHQLRDGDIVQVGEATFEFRVETSVAPGPPPVAKAPPPPREAAPGPPPVAQPPPVPKEPEVVEPMVVQPVEEEPPVSGPARPGPPPMRATPPPPPGTGGAGPAVEVQPGPPRVPRGAPAAPSSVAKKVSPAIFGVCILCFLMPFFRISCKGTEETIQNVSGFELLTGTTIKGPEDQILGGPDPFGIGAKVRRTRKADRSKKVDPHVFAILALLTAVAGLGLSFLKGDKTAIVPAIAAVGGILFLSLLYGEVQGQVRKAVPPGDRELIEVKGAMGYILALLLLAGAAVLNAIVFFQSKKGAG